MSEVHCPKCGAAADERFDCCEVHALTSTEPQTFTMQSDCQCEHPMIKCDQTGCRCTLCGELERLPSSVSRPKLCSHEAIIGLDGKWHCQRCGDAMEMSTASEVSSDHHSSPAATVETKPFSAKENLREVVAQVQADIEAAQLRCSAGSGGRVDQGRPACGQGDEWGNKPTDDPLAAQIERIIRANRLDGIPKISRKIADAITATEPQGAGK